MELIEVIRTNQAPKDFTSFGEFHRDIQFEEGINQKEILMRDENAFEIAIIGFKKGPEFYQGDYEKFRLSMMIYLDILFGKSSKNYEDLFKNQLINYTFGPVSYIEPLYSVILIGGDTRDPDQLVESLMTMINNELDYNQFIHMKNKFYGSMMRMLNYPEAIANEFTAFKLAGSNFFDVIKIVNKITFEDVQKCREFFTDGIIVKMKK
jgi:predicted Zn-dependent peptidase